MEIGLTGLSSSSGPSASYRRWPSPGFSRRQNMYKSIRWLLPYTNENSSHTSNKGIMELSSLRTLIPRDESSIGWNFHSLELLSLGTFVLRDKSSMELLFHGTFVPWNFRSWGQKFLEMLSAVYLLTYKKVTLNNGVSFMQTNISVSFTVISDLQWNETSIKYSNLANIIHWCGTLNPKVSSNNNGKTT